MGVNSKQGERSGHRDLMGTEMLPWDVVFLSASASAHRKRAEGRRAVAVFYSLIP